MDSGKVGIHCTHGLGPPVIRALAGADLEQEGFFLIGLSRGLINEDTVLILQKLCWLVKEDLRRETKRAEGVSGMSWI